MVILSGLVPYTRYNVSIASLTRYKAGPFSSPRQNRTFGDTPEVELEITSVLPHCPPSGLRIQWTRPNSSELYGPIDDVFYIFNYTSNSDGATGSRSVSIGNVTEEGEEQLVRLSRCKLFIRM